MGDTELCNKGHYNRQPPGLAWPGPIWPGNGQSPLALWALWSRWQMAPDSSLRLASPQRSTQISRLYHSSQALVSTIEVVDRECCMLQVSQSLTPGLLAHDQYSRLVFDVWFRKTLHFYRHYRERLSIL
ncbi:hypothetical protein FPSE_11667 [Fusarium pseudograminearum CS3096]|uniref:Uncharacterized protein n=1 Tax=Fusarium pseudograminearum (strain CS3096) TaxID=1028729 RepID=K3VX33_FUSPC|nr:hypothetical protein FPSE_11667 [Fusarium pseudograminearum CS3096]EKJ68200.1 hypothetical protein FPSE_11667 [Fusarium pseudograminearum CS3096]